MPYIGQQRRNVINPLLSGIKLRLLFEEDKGVLTYVLYILARSYFNHRESYTNISNAISCLEDAAHELRRRFLNPYEDKKIKENGDID